MDAATTLRGAITRCLKVKKDVDAHAAWSALGEMLTELTAEQQEAVLLDLAADIDHPILLEYLAAEFGRRDNYEMVVKLNTRALKKCPGQRSLLIGLQTAHLKLGDAAEAAAIAEELATAPVKLPQNQSDAIQRKIDTMHQLVNDAYSLFASGKSVAKLLKTLKRAATLEQELLAFWLSQSPTGVELPEGRGELAASAMYIAALRQAERFGEAADWFREVTVDPDLLDQCLRDFPDSAENTLNNGIGALIDTRDPDDLEYGGDILDFVDARRMKNILLPLACSCLATQRGELERALSYLEVAVHRGKGKKVLSDGGSDICEMARADPDLVPLHTLPRFEEILAGKNNEAKKQ